MTEKLPDRPERVALIAEALHDMGISPRCAAELEAAFTSLGFWREDMPDIGKGTTDASE